jgi:hypothetical protein
MIGAFLLLSGAAMAGEFGEVGKPAMQPEIRDGRMFDPYGELRLLASLPPKDLQLDNEGTMLGQDFVLDSRLRAGLAMGKGGFRAVLEGDLFEGQLAGDAWDVPGEEDARDRHRMGVATGADFDLRKAFFKTRLGPVGMQAGVTTSHWGLGMLANDGNRDPIFGRNDFGDRVVRVQIGARPFGKGEVPLTLSLAGDRVIEDEFSHWTPFDDEDRGGKAWQGIGAALWQPDDGATVGVYGVHRRQTESDDQRQTIITALDSYVDWTTELDGWSLRVAGEGATLLGRTDRVLTYNARDELRVRSGGLTALVEVDPHDLPLRGIFRGGWASGDGNADNDVVNDFAFDRDFDAGMVAHDELGGAIDAAAYDQIGRPDNSGGAPEGADAIVREGAFLHAIFLQPVVAVDTTDWLELRAGATLHWATAPIAHPFTTTRNGGLPANFLGAPTSGYAMGPELNWAVEVGDVVVGPENLGLKPALLLQGGHMLASDNLGGEAVSLVTATGRVRW